MLTAQQFERLTKQMEEALAAWDDEVSIPEWFGAAESADDATTAFRLPAIAFNVEPTTTHRNWLDVELVPNRVTGLYNLALFADGWNRTLKFVCGTPRLVLVNGRDHDEVWKEAKEAAAEREAGDYYGN